MAEGIRTIFSSHVNVYKFKNLIYPQKNKGPIGLKSSGAVAQLIMLSWDQKFLAMLPMIGILILMYLRYIDDGNIVARTIPLNVDFNEAEQKLVSNDDVNIDEPTDIH